MGKYTFSFDLLFVKSQFFTSITIYYDLIYNNLF